MVYKYGKYVDDFAKLMPRAEARAIVTALRTGG
jgi:hypothetical protein